MDSTRAPPMEALMIWLRCKLTVVSSDALREQLLIGECSCQFRVSHKFELQCAVWRLGHVHAFTFAETITFSLSHGRLRESTPLLVLEAGENTIFVRSSSMLHRCCIFATIVT